MKIKLNELSNAIRFLSIDAVQKANSGHPGMPMGMSDVATVLFKYHLRFNPKNPSWINRDSLYYQPGMDQCYYTLSCILQGTKILNLRI